MRTALGFERINVFRFELPVSEVPDNQPSSDPDLKAGLPKSAKRSKQRPWVWPLLIALVVLLVFLLCARSSLADWNDVPTPSMEPNILAGDRIWINKLAYDLKFPFTQWRLATWSEPQTGDIVVFYSPQDGTRMVKRIIGTPGDEIAMIRNQVFINKQKLEYTPEKAPADAKEPAFWDEIHRYYREHRPGRESTIMTTPFVRARKRFPPVHVPEGHYLVLGDNRDLSADYRTFGFVTRADIVGRATSVVVSFDPDEGWSPRWRRFFTALE